MTIGINIIGQLSVALIKPYDGNKGYEEYLAYEEYLDYEQVSEILLGLQNGDYAYNMSDQSILDITNMELICNTVIVDTESLEYEYINNN